MKTLVSATILLIALTHATAQSPTSTSVVSSTPVPLQPGATPSNTTSTASVSVAQRPGLGSAVIVESNVLQTGDWEDQARAMVLVVPGPDLKPETLAGLTEDLTVMCRIFDKALYPGRRSTGRSAYPRTGDMALLGRLLTPQSGRTQGLYLDGYGALFFIGVDFPLVAPPQEKEGAKPEESVDRVWSQTMDELRGQQEPREAGETGPAYDAQKVESLKVTLTKTLRHAANLRVRPQDQITIVVGSRVTTGRPLQEHLRYFYSSPGRRAPVPMTDRKRPDTALADPAATLVLRATKSDVDALAAGKLTADQFAPKVQILWSAAPAQPSEPNTSPQPPVVPTPPGTR